MGSFLGKEKKLCFKRCAWKVGSWERIWERRSIFGKKKTSVHVGEGILMS